MQTYITKLNVIHAEQFTETNTPDTVMWSEGEAFVEASPGIVLDVSFNDYIIRTDDGEFGVCKPDHFESIYEPFEDDGELQVLLFDTYQEQAVETAIYPDNVKIMYPSLGLAGEAGEVANKVKKIYRDKGGVVTPETVKEIGKEIGGVLWYIAALCKDLGLSMSDVAQENLDVLASRKTRGVLQGSGDNR
jgi:NTP pyrophosphatase (non-canonical NTP hydrolase)